MQSLERMTLALAKDELHYGPAQLAELSQKIKLGDLTPILQLYEEDIKRPLKSAVTGTLLRSVFIQVQKAKVRSFQPLLYGPVYIAIRLTSIKLWLVSTNYSNLKS